MQITIDKIKSFNPCESGLDNLVKHYPEFSGTLSEFYKLEKISASDKYWLTSKLMTRTQSIKWAEACARSILHIYESKYPNDKRPRAVLDYLISIDLDNMTEVHNSKLIELKDAANYAASAAIAHHYATPAYYVASAAYYAAASAAASHAIAAAHHATSAAIAHHYATPAASRAEQEDLNFKFALDILEPIIPAQYTTPLSSQILPAIGVKNDSGKAPISMIPTDFITGMAKVFAFGAAKYGANNFRQGLAHSRCLDAALRHLLAIANGEELDPESGLPHLYHAGCSLAMLDYHRINHPELNDIYELKKKVPSEDNKE